ncbi:hypothetical protein SDC9_205716 [bioreactor metagenome]|uniref:Uncharacterized protein n=1 Tax=bioreactor metagenome TaxID=1076179 RepID=A0A645J5N9_9ZZZZ
MPFLKVVSIALVKIKGMETINAHGNERLKNINDLYTHCLIEPSVKIGAKIPNNIALKIIISIKNLINLVTNSSVKVFFKVTFSIISIILYAVDCLNFFVALISINSV